jgi:hypothetical protein
MFTGDEGETGVDPRCVGGTGTTFCATIVCPATPIADSIVGSLHAVPVFGAALPSSVLGPGESVAWAPAAGRTCPAATRLSAGGRTAA